MGRCIQRGPNLSALRESPTGGAPNGMPLKLRAPELLSETPSSMPLAILTRSWANATAVIVMVNVIVRIKSLAQFVDFIVSSRCHHLYEYGVRLLGTALVVNFDSAAIIGEGVHLGPLSRKSVEAKMTTKAVPNYRTPKAPPIYAQASGHIAVFGWKSCGAN